jgi:predicted nucleic acid-binding Zn ribbon protein
MSRAAPRPLAAALADLVRALAPATPLARVQGCWEAAVGAAIAAHCVPVAERAGVLHVACDESVWSAEVELMGPEIVARVAAATGRPEIASLRARTGRTQTSDYRD